MASSEVPERRRRSLKGVARDGAGWLAGLVAGAALAAPVADGERVLWGDLRTAVGAAPAGAIVALIFMIFSVTAAAMVGRLRLPGRRTLDRATYTIRMLPYWIREMAAGGHPGNGRRNPRYATLGQFESEDLRREGPMQADYGVGWGDPGTTGGHRVTWIEKTGELIAVGGGRTGQEPVEVLAVIQSEYEVVRRLADWEYVGFGVAPLRWVRRRAHGWQVPVPPRSSWWIRQDKAPLKPWPAPPPPSLGRAAGAYHGLQGDHSSNVQVVDAAGARPLYHYVDVSPTGFAWGYGGSGPTDLARSLLADRLGYVPQTPVYVAFRDDVVAHLEPSFVLTFKNVDRWIDEHRELIAQNPRAELFDPYAAGGA